MTDLYSGTAVPTVWATVAASLAAVAVSFILSGMLLTFSFGCQFYPTRMMDKILAQGFGDSNP